VQPIVVHLNGYVHGSLPWRAPFIVAGHSDVMSWSAAVGRPIEAGRLARYCEAVKRGLQSADWVVAPSAAMLASLQEHYGPLPRASVIANGRDARPFRRLPKESFVFTAGRLWDPAKNLEAVTAIAPRLSWPIVVAGAGSADSGITHVGQLSEAQIADWLGRASIVALPARYEPFGLLAVEAALAGCALVLGDIPSRREVWGRAADYVHPDDHDALAAAVEGLIAAPLRRAARSAAAGRRARDLTPERMAREYVRIYGCAAARRDVRSVPCAS
jgi:glycogen synthase